MAYSVAGGPARRAAAPPRALSRSALLSRFLPRRRPTVHELRGDKTALVVASERFSQV